jgi:hypothetical protein
MLHSVDTTLVSVNEGVGELLEALSTIRETAQRVNTMLSDLTFLKGLRSSLRSELGSVLVKVSEMATSTKESGQNATLPIHSDPDCTQNFEIQSALPALRLALDRLIVSLQPSNAVHSNVTKRATTDKF